LNRHRAYKKFFSIRRNETALRQLKLERDDVHEGSLNLHLQYLPANERVHLDYIYATNVRANRASRGLRAINIAGAREISRRLPFDARLVACQQRVNVARNDCIKDATLDSRYRKIYPATAASARAFPL
jgi:hypothetical protein